MDQMKWLCCDPRYETTGGGVGGWMGGGGGEVQDTSVVNNTYTCHPKIA